MANYGFNPDELVETKVDLIDKDGFHGVGDAENNGGNVPAPTGLTEGVYFHYQHFNNWQGDMYNTVCGSIIIETAKHQDIFAGSYNKFLPHGVGMLFYDGNIDTEKFAVNDGVIIYGDLNIELMQPPLNGTLHQINEDYIHIPFGFGNTDSIYMDASGEQENKSYIDYIGSKLCIVIPFEVNDADVNVPPVKKIMIFDTVLNINETPGM